MLVHTSYASPRDDYMQLDNFSSIVLYDNLVPRKKKERFLKWKELLPERR